MTFWDGVYEFVKLYCPGILTVFEVPGVAEEINRRRAANDDTLRGRVGVQVAQLFSSQTRVRNVA
eukprot:7110882-Alexandrium_andersonii.AAC.1